MKHFSLKTKVLYSFSTLTALFWIYGVSAAIPMTASPDRCIDKAEKNMIPIDDLLPPHYKEGRDTRKIVEKFSSVTVERLLQSVVDHLYTYHDLCGRPVNGRGGWLDEIGIGLCERLAAFDLTHEKMLSEPASPSSAELTFLQTVYKACRKSTTRYWNHPMIAHVGYEPTTEEYTVINQAVGKSDWTY